MKSEFFYIGHRGTRTDFDENTIKAFEIAIEYGANYIELDIRKTKDDQLIIIHDTTLDRTTNGSGPLNDHIYEDISFLKTKKRQNQIPLLSEVLKLLYKRIKFMIDLKEENMDDKIIKLIKENDLMEDCIFSGRDLRLLRKLKTNLPKSKICYNITKGRGPSLESFLKQEKELVFKPEMISLKSNLVTSEFIRICHKNDILSLSWDFLTYKNSLKTIKSLINKGIDGILFDNYRNIPKIKQWIKSRRNY